MKERAAIIGCGPAGILTCHAAILHGVTPVVYAPAVVPSRQHGAQYLHSYIPEADLDSPFVLTYNKYGTEEGYQRKIYGDKPVQSSWKKFPEGPVVAWDLGSMYRRLFDRYALLINEATVTANDLPQLVEDFDFVVNTAPLDSIAPMGEYKCEYVWIAPFDTYGVPRNTINYFGDDDVEWYRASNINGVCSTEWPGGIPQPVAGAVKVAKPLEAEVSTPGIWRLGRYGQWKKGVLVDQVFTQASEIFQWKIHLKETLSSQAP